MKHTKKPIKKKIIKKLPKKVRQPKIDPSLVVKLIEFIKQDGTQRDACKYAMIPRGTYMNWKKKNYIVSYQFPDRDLEGKSVKITRQIGFADLVDYATTQTLMLARNTVARAMAKGQGGIAIEILKRRDQRYRDKIDVDNTGSLSVNYGGPKSKFTKKQPPTGSNDENDES